MSARPRLVEEGIPLRDDDDDDDDHAMEEAIHGSSWSQTLVRNKQEFVGARPTQEAWALVPPNHRNSSPSQAPAVSSLAKAAGISTSHRSKPLHLKTRLVVGGEENDCEEPMPMSDDDVVWSKAKAQHLHSSYGSSKSKKSFIATRLVVGGEDTHHPNPPWSSQQVQDSRLPSCPHTSSHYQHHQQFETVERMEGVEDHGYKGPLVVMDGANVAYAYADAIAALEGTPSGRNGKREPDSRGVQVAANYFLSVGVRVLVVIPAPWFRVKPRGGDMQQSNAMMVTPQLEVLHDLKSQGILMAAPPTDDDDAYALMIARREDTRAQRRGGEGGGFVLSCDMFRDAIARDNTGELMEWLNEGSGNGPGRISFAFCDMGSKDDYGDGEMDFVPNPRHPLISWIEHQHRNNI